MAVTTTNLGPRSTDLDHLLDKRESHPIWTELRGPNRVELHFIPTGEPWRNGYVESFNSFLSLTQAQVVISDWEEDYSHRRSHNSLGYQAPAAYAAACTHR